MALVTTCWCIHVCRPTPYARCQLLVLNLILHRSSAALALHALAPTATMPCPSLHVLPRHPFMHPACLAPSIAPQQQQVSDTWSCGKPR
jgi:hypothetical protein